MSTEALIDSFKLDPDSEIGDKVGKCSGEIIGFKGEVVSVKVNPSFEACDKCPLSEFCTQSKAD